MTCWALLLCVEIVDIINMTLYKLDFESNNHSFRNCRQKFSWQRDGA